MGPYCFPIQKSTWTGFQTETPTKNDWETVLYNNKSLKKGHRVLILPSINSSLTLGFLLFLCWYIVRTWTLMTDSWKRKGVKEREERNRAAQFFTIHVKSKWSLLLNRLSKVCMYVCTADWFPALKKDKKIVNERERKTLMLFLCVTIVRKSEPYCGTATVTSCHSIPPRE